MAAEAEETYSTLQVQRLELQRGGSGIEVIDSVDSAPLAMRSLSSDQCAMTVLPGLTSPDIQRDGSGLIVASSHQFMGTPSIYALSEPSTESTPGEKRSELADSRLRQRTVFSLRPRSFWLALLSSILVLAIVIGVTVGMTVRYASKSSSSQHNPSAPSETPDATSSSLVNRSGLASVAWNDSSGVTQHRVYYQDANNLIREPSWNMRTLMWLQKPEAIGQAKPSTPIAAAVAGSSTSPFVTFVIGKPTEATN